MNGANITLNKYSSCQAGLAVQTGFPVTIANGVNVTCPVPGLDRCNAGNVLSSPTVAVDDTNANHIYVAYAQTAGVGESVVLQDSIDGGHAWPSNRAVTLSASSTARRFMPWLCTTAGLANVTWYDRRAATNARNDFTDYYGASIGLTSSGKLGGGTEFQINAAGSADRQCPAGKTVGSPQSWPNGSRAQGDSTQCSSPDEQPELGGRCQHTPPNTTTDSFQACDFSATTNTCPVTESCQTAGGRPKYGDYNGNACAAGNLYAVWASATPPPGQAASGNVDLYFATVPVTPPSCSISFACWPNKGPPGFPSFDTIQCPRAVDFWEFTAFGSSRQFVTNSDSYSTLETPNIDDILVCNTGLPICASFRVLNQPWTCPEPTGPNKPYPQCCTACRAAGGTCLRNARTGGCMCE